MELAGGLDARRLHAVAHFRARRRGGLALRHQVSLVGPDRIAAAQALVSFLPRSNASREEEHGRRNEEMLHFLPPLAPASPTRAGKSQFLQSSFLIRSR